MEYKDMKPDTADVLLAVSLIVCGFIYWNFGIITVSEGASVFIFTSLICAVTYTYMRRKGYRQNRQSLLCLAGIFALAASYVIFDLSMQTLCVMVLQMLFIYWIAATTGMRIRDNLSVYVTGDLIKQVFVIPFSNFFSGPAAIGNACKGRKICRTLLMVAAGAIITIPVAWVVITLLTEADETFGAIMEDFKRLFALDWTNYFLEFILGIPVALYIFGLAFGDTNKSAHGRMSFSIESITAKSGAIHCIPAAIACTVMTLLNVIYAIFLAVQASHMLSAFRGILPGDTTYAEYARSGFFQLCAVAVINLIVVICVQSFVRSFEGKASISIKIEIAVISVFTIGLAATAFRKMYMYIETYGLTQLRVYTSMFMVFLAIVFAIIIVRQVKTFNSSAAVVLLALIMVFAFAYGNIDGHIARYNLDRYEDGTLELMDEATIASLGDGAVPYLYSTYKDMEPGKARDMLHAAIIEKGSSGKPGQLDKEHNSWKYRSIQSVRAYEIKTDLL